MANDASINAANGVSIDGLWSQGPMDSHTMRFLMAHEMGPYISTHGTPEEVMEWTEGAGAFVDSLREAVRQVVCCHKPPPRLQSTPQGMQGWEATRAMFSRILLQADPNKLTEPAKLAAT